MNVKGVLLSLLTISVVAVDIAVDRLENVVPATVSKIEVQSQPETSKPEIEISQPKEESHNCGCGDNCQCPTTPENPDCNCEKCDCDKAKETSNPDISLTESQPKNMELTLPVREGWLPPISGVRSIVDLVQQCFGKGINLGDYGTIKALPNTTIAVSAQPEAVTLTLTPPTKITLRKFGISKDVGLRSIKVSKTEAKLTLDGFPDLDFDVLSSQSEVAGIEILPTRTILVVADDPCEFSERMVNEVLPKLKEVGHTIGETADNRIQVIKGSELPQFDLPQVIGYPTVFLVKTKDGVQSIAAMYTGELDAADLADFTNGNPIGTTKESAGIEQEEKSQTGYPIRGNWWSHPNTVWNHLINSHGYSPDFVRSLSSAEAESLHSDDHQRQQGTGSVKNGVFETYGPARAKTQVFKTPQSPRRSIRYCPSGNCP